jgi:transposase InsO family protein
VDRGGEFLSKEFKQYIEEQGIKHELSAPHMPQQNGVAERANQTIAEAARTCSRVQECPTDFGRALSPQPHTYETAHHHVQPTTSPHTNTSLDIHPT